MGNVPTSARPPTETERLGESTRVLEPLALCAARARFFMARGRANPSAAFSLSLAALAIVAACSSAPARTALQGDLSALKAAIAQAEQREGLGASGVKELAGAVLKRELSSLAAGGANASTPPDAFPDVSACTPEIRPVLEDVASGTTEYSAPAAMALLAAGYSVPRSASQPSPTAEVVEARQAVGARAGARRRALLLHGDAAVRRGALGAALEGAAEAEPADVAALAEAARLDPDREARQLAIRALGHIGNGASVTALSDVYSGAAVQQRREIVLAWSLPASFVAGGGEQLEALTQAGGDDAVLAAIALVGHAESAALGAATLLRAIEGDGAEQRLDAIAAAPWSDAKLREAIGAARQHADPATRVLALWRFVEAGAVDASVVQELAQLATDTITPVGAVARAALARAGKADVKPALRADLAARAADRRTLAALALLELKDWSGAARALGDDSPDVRRTVACRVLAQPAEGGASRDRPAVIAGAPPVVPLLLSESAG
jgi:hypothetical protein